MATANTITHSSPRSQAPSIAPATPSEAPRIDQAAQTVFDESFERAKTSKQYGLGGWIKYGLFSKVSGWLSEDQKTKLDLYNKHAALRAGVIKVETAYQSFIAAEKAVKLAKDPSSLKNAQAVEHRGALQLMSTYNELISLAAAHARELGVSEIAYKADLHKALNKGSQGLIFYTLNRVAGRYCLPTGKLEAAEGFERGYVHAVSNLVLNIQSAFTDSGEQPSIKMVTEAFIEGLASLPEFEQDRLKVLDCYMAIAKLRNPRIETDKAAQKQLQEAKDKLEKTIIADFLRQLNELMDSDVDITLAHIRKITSHGISLFQWREFTEAEVNQLNELRKLKKALKAHKEVLETDCELIAAHKQNLADEPTFTVREISEFLEFCLKGGSKQFLITLDQKLNTISETSGLVGFSEYKKAVKALAEIEQQIAVLNTKADPEMKKLSQDLTDQQQKVTQLTEKQGLLKQMIKASLEMITSLEQELIEYKKSFQLAQQEVNSMSQKEKVQWKFLLGSDFVQKGQQEYLGKVKKLEANIDAAQAALQSLQTQIAQLEVEIDQASTNLEEVTELKSMAEARNSKALFALKAEQSRLAETPIQISGKAVGFLGESLGIRQAPRVMKDGANSILTSALQAHLQMKELREDRKQDDVDITAVTSQIFATCLPLGLQYDESEQSFVFQAAERVQIQEFVDSNLDISAEVTARLLDSSGQKRRQTDIRQLTNQTEEGAKFRQQMAGEGLYSVISSRIHSSRSADEDPEDLGVETFEIGDDDVFGF